MFDRTTIQAGPSHVSHEHHQHLAPTAEHLRLLREYKEQADAEAQKAWYQGNLVNVGFGEVHVRRYRLEARDEDAVDVAFNVQGKLHKLTVKLPDRVVRDMADGHYIDALFQAVRDQLAAYLVEHVLLDRVIQGALHPAGVDRG